MIKVTYFSRYGRESVVITFGTREEAQVYIDINSLVSPLPGLRVEEVEDDDNEIISQRFRKFVIDGS